MVCTIEHLIFGCAEKYQLILSRRRFIFNLKPDNNVSGSYSWTIPAPQTVWGEQCCLRKVWDQVRQQPFLYLQLRMLGVLTQPERLCRVYETGVFMLLCIYTTKGLFNEVENGILLLRCLPAVTAASSEKKHSSENTLSELINSSPYNGFWMIVTFWLSSLYQHRCGAALPTAATFYSWTLTQRFFLTMSWLAVCCTQLCLNEQISTAVFDGFVNHLFIMHYLVRCKDKGKIGPHQFTYHIISFSIIQALLKRLMK